MVEQIRIHQSRSNPDFCYICDRVVINRID